MDNLDFEFDYQYIEVIEEFGETYKQKLCFICENGEKKEFDVLPEDEGNYIKALKRIHKMLISPKETLKDNTVIPFDIEIAEKTIANIKKNKTLLDFFGRGGLFTADRLKKTSKMYQEFIKNDSTLKLENQFYVVEIKGYILTTQHKKLLLASMSNTKEIKVDLEGRIIIHTTARALALKAGFCTNIGYGADIKKHVIKLLKELRSATISIKEKSIDKEIIFGFIDEIRRENDNLIITFSKIFSREIHEKYLSFLPKELNFRLPALIFDTILYFATQTNSKSNKKIGFKKLAQIMHINSKYRLQDYKQMLKEYETELQKHNIQINFEEETVEQIIK